MELKAEKGLQMNVPRLLEETTLARTSVLGNFIEFILYAMSLLSSLETTETGRIPFNSDKRLH